METKSSKQFVESATNLWNKYHTDLFFRTTCHIIVLQTILAIIIIVGLWFVTDYLIKDIAQILINTFEEMLQGQNVTSKNVTERLENIHTDQFLTVMILTAALILSFAFVTVYIALTPTRRSLERKKRFVSNISHELRTPLAIMRTNTDVALLDKEIPSKIRNMLQRNLIEFNRISDIMNNLLGLSNLMRDGQVQFEDIDLSVVAQRAIDSLNGVIDHKDITITLKSRTNKTVVGNSSALEQVVFNLVKNAIAHTKSGGSITVEVEDAHDGKYITLLVSDTGSGISREDLFHIFEPFYRARKAKKDGGQGLGLAIVNEIVQLHRGKIRVRSTEGQGTTVVVSIKRSVVDDGILIHSEQENKTEEVTIDFSHRILE